MNCALCLAQVKTYDDTTPLSASVAARFGLPLHLVGAGCHAECHSTAAACSVVEARAS